MAYSPNITPAASATPISSNSARVPFPRSKAVCICSGNLKSVSQSKLVQRRSLSLGLSGAILGLNIGGSCAIAARRPPPPPPEEKKDPNVSGVQAKIIASKKRKEAMKKALAKLREKGKTVKEASE
ncbi:hypothetical protein K2173_017285 [Erythroxylum novogranatense]|uniref:Uncharacterized protein n=1 Tax=Erythroxylum novogranatense TaxID=1862640 RepID=A0AAV8U9S0_9ROSI|nr:hypothetical protein K2173_017285 [Erythroxylum novogranatense]